MAEEEYEDEELESEKDSIKPSLLQRMLSVTFLEKAVKELLRLVVFAIVAFIVAFLVNRQNVTTFALPETGQLGNTNAAGAIITRPLGIEWSMDEMIINTSDEIERHFIKAVIVISCEINNPQLTTELEQRRGEVHAAVREIIGSKSYLDLKRIEQQTVLAQEIKTRIQRIVSQSGIIDVFLKEFSVH